MTSAAVRPWQDLRRGLAALSEASWRLRLAVLTGLGVSGSAGSAEPEGPDLRAAVFLLKERLRDVAGDDWKKTVVEDGRDVLAKARVSQRVLVAWVGAVNILIQEVEAHCASQPGENKKLLVKAIARRLVRKSRLSLPMVPRWAEPLVIDGVVDIGIDFAVALNNRNDGWQLDEVAPGGLLQRLHWWFSMLSARLARGLGALLRPVLKCAALLYLAWTNLRLRLDPLPPDLEDMLAGIDGTGIGRDLQALRDFVTAAASWLHENRERILAFLDLAADVTREAEWFGGLDGPDKKAYARQLLLAVLADMGVQIDSGLGAGLIRFGVDQLIEAGVVLMHGRTGG